MLNKIKKLLGYEEEDLKNEIKALHNKIDHFKLELSDNKKRIKGML